MSAQIIDLAARRTTLAGTRTGRFTSATRNIKEIERQRAVAPTAPRLPYFAEALADYPVQ